jgi:hypothetical protein
MSFNTFAAALTRTEALGLGDEVDRQQLASPHHRHVGSRAL